ncbi:putative metalloprotease CJM1_0395 family protein [Chromatiaceae bacterium AAb-1]|nr:putative metalloprotease CJM1_0395 family protein [Chromatiaceae bacterium AAb-1]
MITSYYPSVSVHTANPPTELARRDALRRELVPPVQQPEKGTAEKPVVTEDKGRQGSAQSPVQGLYDTNGRDAETSRAVEERPQDQQQSGRDADEQQQKQQQQAEQAKIQELQARDREVRVHEQAHTTVGGQYAGAPSYEYETGPDGKKYAVGGEVRIDVAEISGDPQATIRKMQQVKAAALAPAEPSGADRQIAADASQKLLQAQAELMQQRGSVIAGYYQRATEPQIRHSIQQV